MLLQPRAGFCRKKMSTVDTAWLRMDSQTNLMMIVGVSMLSNAVSLAALKHALSARFLVYPRFRSRVVSDLSGVWWQEHKVDLNEHVIYTVLALNKGGASNKSALQVLVGQLSQQALDPAKPLWQMHLVDNCMGDDGKLRQALIIRIHHCIADGVALVGVFMSMFSKNPDDQDHAPSPRAAAAAEENPWEQIMLPVTAASIKAIGLSSNMLLKSLGMMTDLERLQDRLPRSGRPPGKSRWTRSSSLPWSRTRRRGSRASRMGKSTWHGANRCRCRKSRSSARRMAARLMTC